MEWRRINTILFGVFIWLSSQLYWISTDRFIRDGDEEGHVGAAEICKDLLSNGEYISFFTQIFWGDLGEYPPLFASYVGFWWWIVGEQPENIGLRSTILIFPLLSALFCAWISKTQKGSFDIVFVIMLFLPLSNGLARHYMIENPLPALMACCIGCISQDEKKWHVAGGLILGIALLCKQNAFLYVLPFLVIFYQKTPMVLCGSLIAAPWYMLQMEKQSTYIQQSISSSTEPHMWEMIASPFLSLFWENSGPVGLLIFLLLWKQRMKLSKEEQKYWIAFALTMILFVVLPKKYPRLMIGILPLFVILFDTLLKREHVYVQYGIAVLFVIQYFGFSFLSIPPNILRIKTDDRCPQIWNRPPYESDMGLENIAKEIQRRNMNLVRIYAEPIDCNVQTTHPFPYHLEIYLRRRNLETIIEETDKKNAMIIWNHNNYTFQ